jgi:hypothetical protein
MNSSTGSQTLSGTFVGGSTETILTKTMVALICQPQSPGVYKWIAFGNTAAITGLRETVEDYCAGLFTAGTQVGLTITYDDSGAAESIAIIYGAASDITDTGTTSTDKLAGAVAGKAANAGHKHALGAHTHVDATTGGAIAHTALTSIGTNTHAQLDTHVANTGATVHGLGTMSTQNAGTVAITGGTVTGITDLVVADGGSGASTFTDGGILLGSGANPFTALGQATNGQLPIGATGLDPILATITAGDGIDVTNASGAITVATDVKANSGIVIDTTELALDLGASGITGTLAVGDGGTGASTLVDHGVLLGSGTGAVTPMSVLTNGQLIIGVSGADPSTQACSATPGAATVPISDGSNHLDGWISTATAATPGLVEHQNWSDFVPTWTFTTADPAAPTKVGRYMLVGNMCTFYCSLESSDGNDGVLTGVTLPVAPTDSNTLIPLRGHQKIDATWSDCLAFIDATTSLNIQLHTSAACTNAAACAYYISGSYEVAAT